MYSVSIAVVFLLFAYSLAEENVEDGRRRHLFIPGHGHGHGHGHRHGHGHGSDNAINVYHHYRREGSLSNPGGIDLDVLCVEPNKCRRSEGQFSNIIDLMKLIQSIVYVHEEQKKASGGGASKPGSGGGASKPGSGGGASKSGGSKPGAGKSGSGGAKGQKG